MPSEDVGEAIAFAASIGNSSVTVARFSGVAEILIEIIGGPPPSKEGPLALSLGGVDLSARSYFFRGSNSFGVYSFLDYSTCCPSGGEVRLTYGSTTGTISVTGSVQPDLSGIARELKALVDASVATYGPGGESRQRFRLGERIFFSLVLVNRGDKPVRIVSGVCPSEADYTVIQGREAIWNEFEWLRKEGPLVCPQELPTEVEVPPGGSYPPASVRYGGGSWQQDLRDGHRAGPGEYRIVAEGAGVYAETKVVIQEEGVGVSGPDE